MGKGEKLIKDINVLVKDVMGFDKFLWVLTYIMVVGFIMGIVVGLN